MAGIQPDLFGTDGIRGKFGSYPMTVEVARKVGSALSCFVRTNEFSKRAVSKQNGSFIIVGSDTRQSCNAIIESLAAGITYQEVDVWFSGCVPTPAVAYLTRQFVANAGFVVSASHNHYRDNGIKIFDSGGYKLSRQWEINLENRVETEKESDIDGMPTRIRSFTTARYDYLRSIERFIPDHHDLYRYRIALDCAHGAGHDVAPEILRRLGAEIYSIGVEPNGININEFVGSLNSCG